MNEEPTIEDWKATAHAAIWFPFRRAVTRSFAGFIQDCITGFDLQRCLYIGFESPSVIEALQGSLLTSLHTSSTFDHWHTEADWWGDESRTTDEPTRRAFMQAKVKRVIEGDPDDIDFLYLDRDLDETRLKHFREVLRGSAVRNRIKPKVLMLADIQEVDGPAEASSIARQQGWMRIRVADSYLPHGDDNRPETFVSHVFVPVFSQGTSVVELAYKHHLSVDTKH